MVVTGGCGDHECWHNTQTGTVNLTETCAMVYVLKFLDNLLQLEGDSLYGDLMERAIYNQLFSAQSPDGRKLRYYTPFDGPRSYFPKDTYCCPNNYRRAMSDLPEWIYYRSGDGVTVNLYTASSARVKLENGVQLSIAQETDYPNSGTVTLRIDPDQASEFSVSLRIPRWCAARNQRQRRTRPRPRPQRNVPRDPPDLEAGRPHRAAHADVVAVRQGTAGAGRQGRHSPRAGGFRAGPFS